MILAAVLGGVAGVLSGMFGVGGGIMFVPALAIVLSLSQVRAEATSLLAIVPVALVGAVQQYRYGNVEARDGVILGAVDHGQTPDLVVFIVLIAVQFVRRFLKRRGRPNEHDKVAADGSVTPEEPR